MSTQHPPGTALLKRLHLNHLLSLMILPSATAFQNSLHSIIGIMFSLFLLSHGAKLVFKECFEYNLDCGSQKNNSSLLERLFGYLKTNLERCLFIYLS